MLADPSPSGMSAEHQKNTDAEKKTEAQKEHEAEPASRHQLNYLALGLETWLTHPALAPGNWFHRSAEPGPPAFCAAAWKRALCAIAFRTRPRTSEKSREMAAGRAGANPEKGTDGSAKLSA